MACVRGGEGVRVELQPPFYARDPMADVKRDGVVAIDFGTKSTMAGYLDGSSLRRLIRIGAKELGREESDRDYENPTAMELISVEAFLAAYHGAFDSRPFTSWDHVRVSYEALDNFYEAGNDDFYRFFTRLKQWAGTLNTAIRLRDEKQSFELPPFLRCEEGAFNPIEIYAYYLGRYINTMNRGIFLDYLLSFPVKYSKEVREKIRASFELGISKSIPKSVLASQKLSVKMAASEPAAYAISALKEYGFYSEAYQDQRIYYGVFDFGGGTTDFDFGVWRGSENRRYDFEIRHFGSSGDEYLGGENLLELLSFEVFKANAAVMREKNCSFVKPARAVGFGGDETLIKDTQEAMKNTAILARELRGLWEHVEAFLPESSSDGVVEGLEKLKEGRLALSLVDNRGEPVGVNVSFDTSKLIEILRGRIAEGVESFFHSFKLAAKDMEGLDVLHIFLAGNSSRSVLVKEAFEKMISEASVASESVLRFELYPPLGTREADEKRLSRGLNVADSRNLTYQITGKSGVVFGLLDSRSAGKIRVISEVSMDDEAKFAFYLGENRFDCFRIVLDRSQIKIGGEWLEFLDYADVEEFELFYTSNAVATTNKLPITQATRVSCVLEGGAYNSTDRICIRACSPNTIQYGVFRGDELLHESKPITLNV